MSVVSCQVSHVTSNSQTVRARELKFGEKIHPIKPVTCHMSHITCHVSPVTCYMIRVTFIFLSQSGEALWWRVFYQRGRPCLVSFLSDTNFKRPWMATTKQMIYFCLYSYVTRNLPEKLWNENKSLMCLDSSAPIYELVLVCGKPVIDKRKAIV